MKKRAESGKPHLEVQDLCVSYYKRDILLGASLRVMPGEIVSLIGANGAGKSTLLKAIAGIIRPGAGKILLQGAEITGRPAHQLPGLGLGFLMQGSSVFPKLTVMEHLQLASQALKKDDFEERALQVWRTFPKLASIPDRRAGLLSGGEKQMLGLAMMLVQQGRLLVLDEPSAGLDVRTVEELMKHIARLSREEGVSILLAEQNIRQALRISDRVYVVRDGLTHEEDPEAVLSADRLELILFSKPEDKRSGSND